MNRRRTSFVRHSVQWNYLKVVAFAMFAPMLIVTACLYFLIWQTVAYELAIPELIAQALFPALGRVNQVILIGLPIVCSLIFLFAIRMSHQLAGPLYRIEKDLEIMITMHDFTKPIRIRPRDELHSLVTKINRALRVASGPKNR